jgi:hypothetical protein
MQAVNLHCNVDPSALSLWTEQIEHMLYVMRQFGTLERVAEVKDGVKPSCPDRSKTVKRYILILVRNSK